MNGYIKRSVWIASTLLGWAVMVLLAGNAQGADDVLPPEVRALVGMKVPPKIVGKEPSPIPDFYYLGGALVDEDVKQDSSLAYSEGVVAGKWPVFIVRRIASDRSAEILDARVLPDNLIGWRFNGKDIEYLKGRYTFSEHCQIEEKDLQLIFGLVKPEKGKSDCAHFSRRVKLAWQIDRQSGRITSIPTKGVKCEYITMSACY